MSSPQPPPDPQAAQSGLAHTLTVALEVLWPLLALDVLKSSLPSFKAAVAQQVQRHAQASATLATRQYRQQRVAAGVGGGFTPVPADPPTVAQVAQAVDWAVQPLWDSAIPVAALPGAPEETKRVASTAIADAKARLASASEKLVLDTGRDTIVGNVHRDRAAKAWARIPEPDACFFCAMLAARGAVYRSERTASFKTHDHCRCHVEPVFTAYEPSAKIREWQRLYQEHAANAPTGDKLRAFRQAYEGRKVTAGKRGDTPPPKTQSGKAPGRPEPTTRGPEQVRAELTALETNFSRLANDQQREWTNKRIAALRQELGGQ
jgi:hypothetical protein